MQLQNLLAIIAIRQIEYHAAIKTSGTQKCRIKHIRTIRRCHHNYLLGWFKSIHLHQDLVECLLTFVISSTNTGSSHAPYRLNFINENNRWRRVLSKFKKIPHATCTNTHKHLDKL